MTTKIYNSLKIYDIILTFDKQNKKRKFLRMNN